MNSFEIEIYKISEKVGSVFQNPRTQFYTTNTTDEIAFGLENYGFPREEINRRIQEVIRDLNLQSLSNRNIFELSGGEKQKIAIASVYALNPDIYVLDEPSSSLDIESMKELAEIIKKLKEEGKTIVIAEHRLWYLSDLIDRAVYLQDGEIIKELSMSDIEKLSEEERLRTGLRQVKLAKINESMDSYVRGTPLLEIKNLDFYRKDKKIFGIQEMPFYYGNIIGIVGTNGTGKSTFAKIICGLEKQKHGCILKNQKVLNKKKRVKEGLLVMQEVNQQIFTDSVFDEVFLTSDIQDEYSKYEWLVSMGIDKLKSRNPHTLSGGQKQRVIILSALVSNKKILFFDEPTSGLDYTNMRIVADNIKKSKRDDRLILVISHDIEFLNLICDDVFSISK